MAMGFRSRHADERTGEGEEYILNPLADRVYNVVEDAKIISWRTACFARLGFSAFASSALAVCKEVDREEATRLLGAGATHGQVAAILLP